MRSGRFWVAVMSDIALKGRVIGFEESQDYALRDAFGPDSPFRLLKSLDSAISFLVVNPFSAVEEYTFDVEDDTLCGPVAGRRGHRAPCGPLHREIRERDVIRQPEVSSPCQYGKRHIPAGDPAERRVSGLAPGRDKGIDLAPLPKFPLKYLSYPSII